MLTWFYFQTRNIIYTVLCQKEKYDFNDPRIHGFSGKNMIGIITLMIIDIINKNANDKQRIFIDVMILWFIVILMLCLLLRYLVHQKCHLCLQLSHLRQQFASRSSLSKKTSPRGIWQGPSSPGALFAPMMGWKSSMFRPLYETGEFSLCQVRLLACLIFWIGLLLSISWKLEEHVLLCPESNKKAWVKLSVHRPMTDHTGWMGSVFNSFKKWNKAPMPVISSSRRLVSCCKTNICHAKCPWKIIGPGLDATKWRRLGWWS